MKIGIAGAGKTTAMADTIIQFRSEIEDHKKIFCITFTNNAVKCISTKLQEHYGCIPDNIVVSTIHSFLYQEFVRPYYYLLFGKQYERISVAELPGAPAYRNIINLIPDERNENKNEKVYVNSIDSIKGQEGNDCLLILTTDLAAYLLGTKTEETIFKNRSRKGLQKTEGHWGHKTACQPSGMVVFFS